MADDALQPNQWYWIRRDDGSLAPYRFYRLCEKGLENRLMGEFFVGSFIQKFLISRVVGEAQMPKPDR